MAHGDATFTLEVMLREVGDRLYTLVAWRMLIKHPNGGLKIYKLGGAASDLPGMPDVAIVPLETCLREAVRSAQYHTGVEAHIIDQLDCKISSSKLSQLPYDYKLIMNPHTLEVQCIEHPEAMYSGRLCQKPVLVGEPIPA